MKESRYRSAWFMIYAFSLGLAFNAKDAIRMHLKAGAWVIDWENFPIKSIQILE